MRLFDRSALTWLQARVSTLWRASPCSCLSFSRAQLYTQLWFAANSVVRQVNRIAIERSIESSWKHVLQPTRNAATTRRDGRFRGRGNFWHTGCSMVFTGEDKRDGCSERVRRKFGGWHDGRILIILSAVQPEFH